MSAAVLWVCRLASLEEEPRKGGRGQEPAPQTNSGAGDQEWSVFTED